MLGMITHRHCTKCGNDKARFKTAAKGPCTDCRNAYMREYNKKNREAVRARVTSYDHSHIDKKADRSLRTKYGIGLADYARVFDSQGGLCAACDTPGKHVGYGHFKADVLHVDHCHDSGLVRGLLCGRCNLALGGFRDSKGLLLRAVEYLEREKLLAS